LLMFGCICDLLNFGLTNPFCFSHSQCFFQWLFGSGGALLDSAAKW
jgi:hypothetical protein